MPILTLTQVSKRYGAIVVADGLDLALSEGEALGIIGPNGAGKTSLFNLIAGTIRPIPAIRFQERDISGSAPRRAAGSALRGRFRSRTPSPA